MPFFIPRTEGNIPRTVADYHPGNDLMRWYAPLQESVDVYRLTDGSFTERYPIDDLTVLARVYQGGLNKVSQAEADALLAAGYGVGGNGIILNEDMFVEDQFVWELVQGGVLRQAS